MQTVKSVAGELIPFITSEPVMVRPNKVSIQPMLAGEPAQINSQRL